MTRLTLSLVGVIAVAGIAASLVIRHSGQRRLCEQAESFRQQAQQIAWLAAENERLSNQTARATGPQTLSPDQLRELLKLRDQIGRLRQTGKEMVQLQAMNEQLRAALATPENELARARAASNFWAKDQLTYAGYADPEAALKTSLWAMNNGDLKAYVACWAPGAPLPAVRLQGQGHQDPDAEMAAEARMLSASLAPSIGFHILDKQVKSADEVILNLSFDGEGKARKFIVKRVGTEWKLADFLRPGQDAP